MKRIICFFLCTALIFCLCITAFADYEDDVTIENRTLLITADSLEEVNEILAANEAHNRYVESLWNNAVSESNGVTYNNDYINQNKIGIQSLRSYEVTSVNHTDYITLTKWALLTFSATFNTGTDSYGNAIISSVSYLDAYGRTSSTTVQINNSQYALIDHDRTIAANYSCRVGVVYEDETYYFTRVYYVEFYATGGANVY